MDTECDDRVRAGGREIGERGKREGGGGEVRR